MQIEKSMLKQFKIQAYIFIKESPSNDFEWLALAQHFGLPTRLMDWTFNPLVALFFAVENEHETDAAVYCAMPSGGLTIETILFSPDGIFNTTHKAFRIVPDRKQVRYPNQNGLFTLHLNPKVCDVQNFQQKLLIPASARESIRWRLRSIGITKAFIYNTLEGLSHDIVKDRKRMYEDFFN
ncbi:FRG domain-containing protein [Ningiella sp. W23]|uniref:FRG domain-containing protein n=1 Tax=Ningiella sp. W23 TaxID=3023715 RepID=UPI003757B256